MTFKLKEVVITGYRVLMSDQVDGKQFNFAINVEAKNQTGSETLAQYGMNEDDGARWEAGNKALAEFPEALLVEVTPNISFQEISV
jgi:hypothetical protein